MILQKLATKQTIVASAILAMIPLAACRSASATDLSCSDDNAKAVVYRLMQDQLRANIMTNDLVDLDRSTFVLEDVRTEDNNGFKLACTAKLITHIVAKEIKSANDPGTQAFAQALIQGLLSGNDVKYTVQITDDGKLYVQLIR